MTLTFTVQDNADNEDGRRLQRSTDGGSTWTTVDDVGANETQLEDADPILYEPVRYRSQVYTEHVVSNSGAIEVVAVLPETAYAELELGSDRVIVKPADWTSISVSPEHTAIWGADLTIAPGDRSVLDYGFYELEIYYGSTRFFDGECRVPEWDAGSATATLQGYGKTAQLEKNSAIVSYPDAIAEETGVPIHEAIADYWDRTPASATVYDFPANTVRTAEPFYELPEAQQFNVVFDIAADVPITATTTSLDPEQTCWFQEAENTVGAAVIDTTDAPSDHSNFEAAELDAPGNFVEMSFTPMHDFPASDFVPRIRYEIEDFTGFLYLIVNGSEVDLTEAVGTGGQFTEAASWGGDLDLQGGQTVDSIPDFVAGQTYDFRVEVRSNSNGDFNGRAIIDCLAPRDSGDRFGGWTYTEDNQPNMDESAQLTGPELYFDAVDVEITADELWHIPSAELTTVFDDTSTNQAVALSVDGENYATAPNAESVTADFDARDEYGTRAIARLTISRYDSGEITESPTQGDVAQSVSELELLVDTDDLPIITPEVPLTLEADTHLANLQTLHEAGDCRFVVDHSADGLVVESFRRGDSAVAKPADWTVTDDGVSETRDTRDYANVLRGIGDGTDVEIVQFDEIERVGTTVPDSITRPDVSDADELAAEVRRELIRRSSNDELSGQVPIAPHLVLPGYPYTVPSFDGEQANLNGVQFEFGADVGRGQLQFGKRRTLARQVSEIGTRR